MDRHNRDRDRIWRRHLFCSYRRSRDAQPDFGTQWEADTLQAALALEGVKLHIVNVRAAAVIQSEVQATMKQCSYFVAFACEDYGEFTRTAGNTFEELQFWKAVVPEGGQTADRHLISINMLRPGETHKHDAAEWEVGTGRLTLFWPKRAALPAGLVGEILQGLGLEPQAQGGSSA